MLFLPKSIANPGQKNLSSTVTAASSLSRTRPGRTHLPPIGVRVAHDPSPAPQPAAADITPDCSGDTASRSPRPLARHREMVSGATAPAARTGSASARARSPPLSPASALAKGKGGRKAANPHLSDDERRRERVLKNRESAMKSLQKKKLYTEDLEARASALHVRNAELKFKIRALLARLSHPGAGGNTALTSGIAIDYLATLPEDLVPDFHAEPGLVTSVQQHKQQPKQRQTQHHASQQRGLQQEQQQSHYYPVNEHHNLSTPNLLPSDPLLHVPHVQFSPVSLIDTQPTDVNATLQELQASLAQSHEPNLQHHGPSDQCPMPVMPHARQPLHSHIASAIDSAFLDAFGVDEPDLTSILPFGTSHPHSGSPPI
jgi:Basic region leucine zipper